jgi:hypothetical protein
MIKSDKKGTVTGGTGSAGKVASTDQHISRVEPMYAFDIHCNGFFPVMIISYAI